MRARKAVVVGVMLTLASGWACAQTIYRLTDLGTRGGQGSTGYSHQRLGTGDGFGLNDDSAGYRGLSRLPVGRQHDAGPRHAGAGKCGFSAAIAWLCHQRLGAGDGSRATRPIGTEHAFLWDGTTLQDLGTLGGTFSQGNAINASGQVTGIAYVSGRHDAGRPSPARIPVGRYQDARPRHAGRPGQRWRMPSTPRGR